MENVDSTTIEGTWKLVGQNLGLPDGYIKVTDGELFTLNNSPYLLLIPIGQAQVLAD